MSLYNLMISMIFMPLMTMTASHVHYDLDDLDEPGDDDALMLLMY